MTAALAWVGARAQWVLAIGVVAALLLPGPGSLLEGTVPFWVTLLFGLAMTRIDLGAVARRAIGPRRLVRNLGFCAALVVGTPTLFWALGTAAGLDPAHVSSLVYTSAAPPLGSGAAFCLILGFDAAFAIEITVLSSLITPVTLPVVSRALLGDAVPIDTTEMAWRLALLIGIGSLGAVLARAMLGAERITRHARSFDGLSSIILVVFLFPLFEGMGALILAMPGFAAMTFLLACLANLGVQIVTLIPCCRIAGRDTGGAAALVWGNRNAAMALASLPPDPLFTLYVALYQFPMYFTPLVMRRVSTLILR